MRVLCVSVKRRPYRSLHGAGAPGSPGEASPGVIVFSESAELYDLIYSRLKDYAAEAERVAALIREVHPEATQLLDVACGTGEHARLLACHGFQVDGIDLDPGMVRLAAAKVPAGRFRVADMTDFTLGRSYDAVLCLFSSIGYVRTLANVERTLASFRRHLAPGGIVIVEPWFAPGVLQPGRVTVNTAEAEGVKVCRMAHTQVDGRLSRLRMDYLIGQADGVRHATELHELGIFTPEEMQDCFRAAGLAADYDPEGLTGRGLYVARAA